MADGRHFENKSIYRHISVKNHPILIKFCTQQQILNVIKNEKVALERLRVRQNVLLVVKYDDFRYFCKLPQIELITSKVLCGFCWKLVLFSVVK